MKILKLVYLGAGLGLLAWVLVSVDIGQAWAMARTVGWGLAVVLVLYFIGFVIDSATWQLAIPSFPLDLRHLYRTWKVRMVGEVFNNVLPLAGMGGEPVKTVMLNKHYGVSLREGTASVILAKTVNTIALVLFLMSGFVLILLSPALSAALKSTAAIGLGALGIGVWLFYLVQRHGVTSLTGHWLSRWKPLARLAGAVERIRDMEGMLLAFYVGSRKRFLVALLFAVLNWVIGVFEVYATLHFLGQPVSLTDAWIIETAVQLVRAGAFVIPAGLGAQEGTFLVLTTALTGVPAEGLAVAMVRRTREVIWLLWGTLLGALFSRRERANRPTAARPRGRTG